MKNKNYYHKFNFWLYINIIISILLILFVWFGAYKSFSSHNYWVLFISLIALISWTCIFLIFFYTNKKIFIICFNYKIIIKKSKFFKGLLFIFFGKKALLFINVFNKQLLKISENNKFINLIEENKQIIHILYNGKKDNDSKILEYFIINNNFNSI